MKSHAENEEEVHVPTQPTKRKKLTLDDHTGTSCSKEQELVTTTTDTDGEVVVVLLEPLMTTPQKRKIPQSSSPFSRKKVKRFVSLQESPVGQQRDEDGRVMYSSEIFHGVTLDLGQGCKGVEETDVTVLVTNKVKTGTLPQDRVTYSFGKKKGAPVNIVSKVEETSSCIVPSSSSLLNRKPLDAGTVISVEEGVSSDPVSTSTSVASTSIWDTTSTMMQGEWKCDICSIRNGKEATECVACAHRPSAGLGGEGENAVAAPAPAAASIPKFSIGTLDKKKKDKRVPTGGFTFAAPTKADNDDPTPARCDFSPAFTFGAGQKSGEKKEGYTFAAPKVDDDDPAPAPVLRWEFLPASTFGPGKPAPTNGGFTFGPIPNFSVGKPATGGFTFAAPTKADNDDPAPVRCEFPPASTFGAGQKAIEKKEDNPAPDTLGFCFGEEQKTDDEKENKPAPTDGGVVFRASGEEEDDPSNAPV